MEAIVFSVCGEGETVFISHIPLNTSDHPFQLKSLKFPVGFSHGLLYVACSRVSSADSLIILQPEDKTANVVGRWYIFLI